MPTRHKSVEKAFGDRIMREEKLPRREREKLRHRRQMLAAALELTNAFLFCWLEDPKQHPYEANVSLITELFLKGCLAK